MLKQKYLNIGIAGWPTRKFSMTEFENYLAKYLPPLVEISKDFLRDEVSIKELRRVIAQYKETTIFSFAGTTDLTKCAGFNWLVYCDYLSIQAAQARFLGCSYFRCFVGQKTTIPIEELLRRLEYLSKILEPLNLCIEIHGGYESNIKIISSLIEKTRVDIVVDFANMLAAKMSSDELMEVLPQKRIAYFHIRNLPGVWEEDTDSANIQEQWCYKNYEIPVLWEPKSLTESTQLRELLDKYAATN